MSSSSVGVASPSSFTAFLLIFWSIWIVFSSPQTPTIRSTIRRKMESNYLLNINRSQNSIKLFLIFNFILHFTCNYSLVFLLRFYFNKMNCKMMEKLFLLKGDLQKKFNFQLKIKNYLEIRHFHLSLYWNIPHK